MHLAVAHSRADRSAHLVKPFRESVTHTDTQTPVRIAFRPQAGLLYEHMFSPARKPEARAARARGAAAGPLVPVARGRLRRRLGGRPGRVAPSRHPYAWERLRRPMRSPRGGTSASDGSTESSRRAAPRDRCVRGADLSMSCRRASSRRSVARLLLAGEILRGYAARGGVVKEPLVPNGPVTKAIATPRAAPRGGSCARRNRRRPTLPGPCEPSTIGAEGLNCSVRNGKRCFPLAKATGKT